MRLILCLWKHNYLKLSIILSKTFFRDLWDTPVLFSVKADVPAYNIILLPLTLTAFS